jgi:hypothetical protein
MRRICRFAAIATLLIAGCASSRTAHGPGGDLPYPFTERPKAEEIVHLPTGLALPFQGAMDMISGARLVCVGETHDNLHAHRVELLILRELHRRNQGTSPSGWKFVDQRPWAGGRRGADGTRVLKAIKWYETGLRSAVPGHSRLRPGEQDDVLALNLRRKSSGRQRFGLDNVPRAESEAP